MQAEKVTYHEFSDNLDSSDAFEGPEKTLRVFFKKPEMLESDATATVLANGDSVALGLLQIPRRQWEVMLDLVKCKVLSVLIHPNVHAYVLSESSLFVYPDHVVLKTCGTTTLLEGLPKILSIVEEYYKVIGMKDASVESVVYSRRSFFNPEKQLCPHGCWDDEVKRLKEYFAKPRFACYLGANRDERWHVFTFAPPALDMATEHGSSPLNDGWLEMMMTGIDSGLASRFYHQRSLPRIENVSLEDSVMSLDSVASVSSVGSVVGADPDDDDPGHALGNVMTRTTGIDDLFRTNRQLIDSFAFTPCGYSCNGILLDLGKYFTIHVTPQTGFSYASFETNVVDPSAVEPGLTFQILVDRVLEVFAPQKLTLAICTSSPRKLVDVTILGDGEYSCTTESGFDLGNENLYHYILEKH